MSKNIRILTKEARLQRIQDLTRERYNRLNILATKTEVKCEEIECGKLFLINTYDYETKHEYNRIFRCDECYKKYIKTFPKLVEDRPGWWYMSPGYSVPEWIYREAKFNRDGSMKEEIIDR